MSEPSRPTIVTSPEEYFNDMIEEAFERRKMKTFPMAKQYLVQLLNYYISTENLYPETEERTPTLAELLLKASISDLPSRVGILKKLGDTSLYVSGFFADSLSRKIVDIDYYADMGCTAYGQLSETVREDTFKEVYNEISSRFVEFVDVLAVVSHKVFVHSDENLLRVYEKYIRTGSEVARETLVSKGIVPNEDAKKKVNQ